MKLIRIFFVDDRQHRLKLYIAMLVAGISPIVGLMVINLVIRSLILGQGDLHLLPFFAAVVICVIVAEALALRLSVRIIEQKLEAWRARQLDLVRGLDLNDFDAIGNQTVYDTVTRNTATISNIAVVFPNQFGGVVSLAFGCIYAYFLSPLAFAVYAMVLGAGALSFLVLQRTLRENLIKTHRSETNYLNQLRHFLTGFKEVRLNQPRGDDLEQNYLAQSSTALGHDRIQFGTTASLQSIVVQAMSWGSIAIVAFLLPLVIADGIVTVQAIYVGIALRGYLVMVLFSFPNVSRADAAVAEIGALEKKLETFQRRRQRPINSPDFSTIELGNIEFQYNTDDDAGFAVGPIDMQLQRGETVFLVGENGGGKSTILKLLCGLYRPDSGAISLNGMKLEEYNEEAYRSLFSSVFTDFHLFDRLYGLSDLDDDKANKMLDDFALGEKTQVKDGVFTSTDLSTGQRQRLALAVALLEDRPILLLDEVAADQDPAFRTHLYRNVLPELKKKGRTMVVVSHDNRYFDIADRVVTVRDGKIDNDGADSEK